MTKRIYYLDLLERTAWTFLQGFAGAWITDGVLGSVDLDWGARLTIGATAGLAAVLKGVLAKGVGDDDSAATLPSPPDVA